MKIILLEFIDEAEIILSRYGKGFFNSGDVITVCLHPRIRAFLKDKGIDSKDTLDYVDNNAQHRIILKTEELVNQFMQKICFVDAFGIKKGYEQTCIHHLHLYINHFLWIIEILRGIKQKHAISEIYCCLPKDVGKMYTKNTYIQNEERFLGLMAQDFCKENKITFYGIHLETKKRTLGISLITKVIHTIGSLISIMDYAFCVAKKPNRKKIIVVPALSYRMDSILREIKQRNADVRCIMIWEGKSTLRQELLKIYLTLSNFLKKFKNKNYFETIIHLDLIRGIFRKDVKQQKIIEEEFDKLDRLVLSEMNKSLVYNGVAFGSYLREKAYKGLKQEILSLQHTTMVLANILKRLQPKLLMSMYSLGIYYTMGELSDFLKLCSLNISHGTHVPPNNEFEKIENYRLGTSVILNTYRYVAVQTPWADKFLNYYRDTRPRILSGPLLYSKKDNDFRKQKRDEILGVYNNTRIIVHASTQKARYGMRFHIDETLDEYISSLTDLVAAIERLDDVVLVIRPHPTCDISEADFRTLLPTSNKVRIINRGSFQAVLSIADLLVSYSSTCIEEALQNKVPVVLYDKWSRYNHFNIKVTESLSEVEKKPVYYVTETEILKECLPRILDTAVKAPLSDLDLKDYRYPEEFRLYFNNFVDKALTGLMED